MENEEKETGKKKHEEEEKEMKARSGVRVIIAEEPCMLFARRTLKQNRPQVAEVVQSFTEAVKSLCGDIQIEYTPNKITSKPSVSKDKESNRLILPEQEMCIRDRR